MVVMVALLRGVNVGGAGTLPMADLRQIATATGLGQVRTYIQSGNLVFSTPTGSTASVASTLRTAIAKATPLDPEVIVRTRAELAAVIEDSPFLRRGEDPAHLHVVFMAGEAASLIAGFDPHPQLSEEVAALGREMHLFLPGGVGRSKLAAAVVRRTGPVGTMRNWRTLTKLLEMADDLEVSASE